MLHPFFWDDFNIDSHIFRLQTNWWIWIALAVGLGFQVDHALFRVFSGRTAQSFARAGGAVHHGRTVYFHLVTSGLVGWSWKNKAYRHWRWWVIDFVMLFNVGCLFLLSVSRDLHSQLEIYACLNFNLNKTWAILCDNSWRWCNDYLDTAFCFEMETNCPQLTTRNWSSKSTNMQELFI